MPVPKRRRQQGEPWTATRVPKEKTGDASRTDVVAPEKKNRPGVRKNLIHFLLSFASALSLSLTHANLSK